VTGQRLVVALVMVAGVSAGMLAGCGGSKKKATKTATTKTIIQTVGQPIVTDTTATTPTGVGVGSQSSSGIVRPFAANSPWNTPIQSATTDGNSDKMMLLARERLGVTEVTNNAQSSRRRTILNNPLFINLHRWTDPVVDETNGAATALVCRQPPLPPLNDGTDNRALCGDGWLVSQLTVPAAGGRDDPHPEFDGWYTILDRGAALGYDLWRARRSTDGGSISYQFMRRWDLNGPGFLAPNRVSARGSGLPLFAGLILPEEIQAGRIDHALAISVPAPAQRIYVQPASSTDGIGETDSLPEGARIRLKSNVTLRSIRGRYVDLRCNNPLFGLRNDTRRRICKRFSFPTRTNRRAAGAIITALHRYGAIVVDRARVPTLYAKFNADWSQPLRNDNGDLLDQNGLPFPEGVRRERTPLLRGNELQGIRLADFEVIQLGTRYQFPADEAGPAPVLPGGVSGQVAINRRSRGARTTTTPQQQTFQPAAGGG
jgi:hypothetical protein